MSVKDINKIVPLIIIRHRQTPECTTYLDMLNHSEFYKMYIVIEINIKKYRYVII